MLNSSSLQEALVKCSALVEAKIDELLPKDFADSNLVAAMRYSSLSSGKRVRPFLVLACANIFDVGEKEALTAAVAMELVHTYSLIHDDLPAMDDDDVRRGQKTCHKKFDEATAILAGDSLLTYAFEILANSNCHPDAIIRCELVRILAHASGFLGMAGGQMMDLENENKEISKEELVKLHRLKTGELFMASAQMGAVLGQAKPEELNALKNFAHDLGLAFQIKDDILDHVGVDDEIELDETAPGKDKENASVVDIIGMDDAKQRLVLLKDQAILHLNIFDEKKVKILKELVEFVVARDK